MQIQTLPRRLAWLVVAALAAAVMACALGARATEVPPTEADAAAVWAGYEPPLKVDELCGLLTAEEITAIQGWTWQRAEGFEDSEACVYDTVDDHSGALVRFSNYALREDEFRAYYPDAMDLDGVLLADAYDSGVLDDIWIEVTGQDNLKLEIFGTAVTEEQSLALVEAVFP